MEHLDSFSGGESIKKNSKVFTINNTIVASWEGGSGVRRYND